MTADASTSGSPVWQLVFVSFAAVLILFEIVRGAQQGLPRQLVRLVALVAAYAAGYFGGALLVPVLRPVLVLPDFLISMLGGAVLAFLIYFGLTTIGRFLLPPVRAQPSAIVRLVYRIGGGAVGIIFALFFLWLLIVGLRSLGSVTDAQLHARVTDQPPIATAVGEMGERSGAIAKPTDSSLALASWLTRAKNSVELGRLGDLVKMTDVLPAGSYQTLGKLGTVLSRPRSAQRFFTTPAVREIVANPKIAVLRTDPVIQRLLREGRYLELLQDRHLIEALNDRALLEKLQKFDFRNALEDDGKRE